jgi:hypothetical protein
VRGLLALLVISSPALAEPPTFRLLSRAEQAKTASVLATKFPKTWHAKIEVDEAGFPSQVELEVPTPVDDEHAVERALEIVRDRADMFGVTDGSRLHARRDGADVAIGQGARWTGKLSVHYEGRRVVIWGHLWPVATPPPLAIDRNKLLAPYVGLRGKAPSKCCKHNEDVVTRADNFRVDVAVALICDHGTLTPKYAIGIRAELGAADVPGLEDMPRLLDAYTRERIDDDFWMPPYGAGERYPREEGTVQAHMTSACFYRGDTR